MSKKEYENPCFCVIRFEEQDVLTMSGSKPVQSEDNLTFENYASNWL